MRASPRTAAAAGLAWLLLLAGCTWSAEEPGLFREGPSAPASSSQAPLPPLATNPALPVAGEATWTTAEGLALDLRLAVHAVRRIDGASVLDLSVTPLASARLRPGERVPGRVDLGLTREAGGDVDAFLVDAAAGAVYRPVSHRDPGQFRRCLCSPVWLAQLDLRIAETRMLQITFPPLPAGTSFVDVSLATLPPFAHVPVTDRGLAPTALAPVDLARPASRPRPVGGPLAFTYEQFRDPRRQSIEVDSVTSAPSGTAVRWTVRSLTDQPGFTNYPSGPPISDDLPDGLFALNPGSAYGPALRAGGTRLRARFLTATTSRGDYYECLCTNLGLWAAGLREAGGAATVTTNYPPLPAGTTSADLELTGVGVVRDLPVTAAADSAARLGPAAPADTETWVYAADRPPSGWSSYDWPTPLPDPGQLVDFEVSVERFATPPGWR